ncbi:hypothetical protein V494_08421 [Pseudogymnoascus sp. VKM F-4513 (FW-928)]|nr:hypothetical protein V494_08421 [Pseudogymnoascus sp. VKM F-4513 (FW-928)]
MELIQKSFVSADTYNSLPTIQEAANSPEKYAADLVYLQRLLAKHNVPKSVSIRLIHRHYDIADGDAMVFRNIALPAHGTVEVMRATPATSTQLHGIVEVMRATPATSTQLHGILVCLKLACISSAGQLQAYEYTTDTTIDISEYGTFVAEFVEIVIERKLQHKFGLKINDYNSKIGVSVSQKEFEFPEEQYTITIPVTLPLPEDTHEISC